MNAPAKSRVTIHMAASLDGFIARKNGSTDWLETSDEFADGEGMDPAFVEAFLRTIDCYVMGSRTYETALAFEAKGLGWVYGDKPTFVLTSRELPRIRDTVEFHSGELAQFVNNTLRPRFRSIWFVGGGAVSGQCLCLGLADEIRYSILPILVGDGIRFFEKVDRDVPLHLTEVKAYKSGMVGLCYEVRKGMSSRSAFASVPDYLSALEPARRRVLKRVLSVVKKSVPKSTVVISYGIPAFKQDRVFIYCAAFKQHIGIFPPVRDAKLKAVLKPYSNARGNLRLPLDEPMPLALVARVAKALARQHA